MLCVYFSIFIFLGRLAAAELVQHTPRARARNHAVNVNLIVAHTAKTRVRVYECLRVCVAECFVRGGG